MGGGLAGDARGRRQLGPGAARAVGGGRSLAEKPRGDLCVDPVLGRLFSPD